MSLQKLADIRRQIADAESKIAEIERASLPAADVAERVRGFIQNLQARFDHAFVGMALVSADGLLTSKDVMNACDTNESSGIDKSLVMMAWLSPDLLEARLMQAAQPYVASGKTAIPTDRRPALLKKLDGELSELLHTEEELICELQANGHEVFRRANIDPLVVLAVHQG